MTDTSTEFCERLAHDCELGRKALGSTFQSGQAILDDCAKTLRLIAAERDALRAALERLDNLSAHDAAIVAAALNTKARVV